MAILSCVVFQPDIPYLLQLIVIGYVIAKETGERHINCSLIRDIVTISSIPATYTYSDIEK